MSKILGRIEREFGIPGLAGRLARDIKPTDFQTLLLEVFRLRAKKRRPADLLADYQANRFVRPSAVAPLELQRWERRAFACLPVEFDGVVLSPVAPFGLSAVLGSLAQNWAITTSRNTEVISDSTGVLALEAAVRRRRLLQEDPKSLQRVQLAASHRLLRGQKFEGEHQFPHFHVISLITAGRAKGPGWFGRTALHTHIRFYLTALRAYLSAEVPIAVSITDFENPGQVGKLGTDWWSASVEGFPKTTVSLDPERVRGRGYYQGLCFNIEVQARTGEWVSLVDGGQVHWTQKLLSSVKERLLISGIGSDRLLLLFDPNDEGLGDTEA